VKSNTLVGGAHLYSPIGKKMKKTIDQNTLNYKQDEVHKQHANVKENGEQVAMEMQIWNA